MVSRSLAETRICPHTFRTFVAGPENALAYQSVVRSVRSPGQIFSPVYICGGPGCGKTHLVRAAGAHLRAQVSGGSVVEVAGHEFLREFGEHIRRGRMGEFRRRYRDAGALLVDDIAALAGHHAAAEELVMILDAIHTAQRQIIVADERPPQRVPNLTTRLRSRLSASLIVELRSPGQATRLSILRQMCEQWNVAVDRAILGALARQIDGSIRDLSAALSHVIARGATAATAEPDHLVRLVVGDVMNTAARLRGYAQVQAVIAAVCTFFDLPRDALLDKNRATRVAQARQMVMYLLREDGGLTATQIGAELGRDHSTVLHGHARIARALALGDPTLPIVLDQVRGLIAQHAHGTLRTL